MYMCLIIMRNGNLSATLQPKVSVDGWNSSTCIHKENSIDRNNIVYSLSDQTGKNN